MSPKSLSVPNDITSAEYGAVLFVIIRIGFHPRPAKSVPCNSLSACLSTCIAGSQVQRIPRSAPTHATNPSRGQNLTLIVELARPRNTRVRTASLPHIRFVGNGATIASEKKE